MPTKLSVNLNKIALIRNSRPTAIPNVLEFAQLSIAGGAQGITLHPRSDLRHVRPQDVYDMADFLKRHPNVELNIEGNPQAGPSKDYPGFMQLIRDVKPTQVTLVPDSPHQLTSDHGWNVAANMKYLTDTITELHSLGCRTAIFLDYNYPSFHDVLETGTDRIELYTEPYARAYESGSYTNLLAHFSKTAEQLHRTGIGINAGHDLNLMNLPEFSKVLQDRLLEVSIGHALTCDALKLGWNETIKRYLACFAS